MALATKGDKNKSEGEGEGGGEADGDTGDESVDVDGAGAAETQVAVQPGSAVALELCVYQKPYKYMEWANSVDDLAKAVAEHDWKTEIRRGFSGFDDVAKVRLSRGLDEFDSVMADVRLAELEATSRLNEVLFLVPKDILNNVNDRDRLSFMYEIKDGM